VTFELPSGWGPLPDDRDFATDISLKAVQRVPLRRFFGNGDVIVCDCAVEAVVSEAESGFIAEIPALKLAAAGGQVSEVVADLSEQVVHFFNFYTELDADEVIGEAVHLRDVYVRQFHRALAQAA